MIAYSDMCLTCCYFQYKIARSKGMTEVNRQRLIGEASLHKQNADKQRSFFKSLRMDSSKITLSFDAAQQVHIPSNPLQAGEAFFKTARKVGIFGVMDEFHLNGNIYVIDESDVIGKGANHTIFLANHTIVEKYNEKLNLSPPTELILVADNCVGQNKNNFWLFYISWLIFVKKWFTSITYNFLLVGHTKFLPDQAFGNVKKAFRKACIDTIYDLERAINNCEKLSSILTSDPIL